MIMVLLVHSNVHHFNAAAGNDGFYCNYHIDCFKYYVDGQLGNSHWRSTSN